MTLRQMLVATFAYFSRLRKRSSATLSFIPDDMRALIKYCAEVEGMPLSVLFAGGFDDEMIFIVRKLKFIWRG